MKSLFIWGLLSLTLLVSSCSKNDEKPAPADELQGLLLVKTISNATHTIDLYTPSGKFETGHLENNKALVGIGSVLFFPDG